MNAVEWIACVVLVVLIGSPLWIVLFPAQHYIDGERTPRHRKSCRRCRKARQARVEQLRERSKPYILQPPRCWARFVGGPWDGQTKWGITPKHEVRVAFVRVEELTPHHIREHELPQMAGEIGVYRNTKRYLYRDWVYEWQGQSDVS